MLFSVESPLCTMCVAENQHGMKPTPRVSREDGQQQVPHLPVCGPCSQAEGNFWPWPSAFTSTASLGEKANHYVLPLLPLTHAP